MTALLLDTPTALPPVAALPVAALPRRMPLPQREPAFDEPAAPADPPPTAPGGVVLTLPLPLRRRSRLAAFEAPELARPAVPPGDGLPPPGQWAAQLLHAIAETDSGLRPIRHLAKCASVQVLEELEAALHRRGGPHGPPGRAAPRPVVGTVRVCRPTAGVAEVSATVRAAGRTLAVALRLEAVEGRWRCTALER